MQEKAYMDLFREAVSERGLKYTQQRASICRVVFNSSGHRTLDEILEAAREEHQTVGYATVYRTMKLMVACGLVEEHKFSDGQARYERATDEHHDHIICVKCAKIWEFEQREIERLQRTLVAERGFKLVSHRHEIYVDCGCEESTDV